MYTHAYDAKVMRIHNGLAALEVDLGFRVWKVQTIKLDHEVPATIKPGDRVRLQCRLERVCSTVGGPHSYYGRIKRL